MFLVCHDTAFLFSTRAMTALGCLPNAHQDMIILVRPRNCNVEKTNTVFYPVQKFQPEAQELSHLIKHEHPKRLRSNSPKYCIMLLLVDMYFKSGFSFTSQRPIKITKVGEQWSCAQIVRQMFTVEASCLQIAAIHKEFSTEPYKRKLLERVNVKYICQRHCMAFYGTANCLWFTLYKVRGRFLQ